MEQKLFQQWQSTIDLFCHSFQHPNDVQHGLSFSIKVTWQNYSNHEESLLLFAQADWSTGSLPSASQWTAFRLNSLRELVSTGSVDPLVISEALTSCSIQGSVDQPSPVVLLHAAATGIFTCFTQPLPLLAQFHECDSEENLKDWLGDRARIYPFVSNLPLLSKLIAAEVGGQKSMILMNRGLLVTSEELGSCLSEQEQIIHRIENRIQKSTAAAVPYEFHPAGIEGLPGLRRTLSKKAGYPLIIHLDQSAQAASLLQDMDRLEEDLQAVLLPDFVARCGLPFSHEVETEPEPPAARTGSAWNEFTPGYGLFPGLGIVATGRSAPEAYQTARVAITNASAIHLSRRSEKRAPLSETEVVDALKWQVVPSHSRLNYSGEIAIVTGAASGIGKACAASLLARGAAVVGLDINPQIEHTFIHPSYYGLVCNVTNEAEVKSALQQTIKRFGGLDMLILNAGMFPKGCHINSISLADFTPVINVNLNANLVFLREAYPLLKSAPLYGRVVIVGSRNLKAPGPGAVAYSTSKAALTQMARIAAMEWAQDGIRVNVIHPDSVFDTGLYTEDVLQARADHYGVSVDQYKKRNLLKTEITSHDVGEMIAEMCGPVFRPITGAQIQMDGGNERTI